MELNKILLHNVLDPWPVPDQFVNSIVTSPPYWGLRDYGVDGQLGLEKTPEEYIDRMVSVFREARRVLRDDGTMWVNIGDSYASTGGKRTEKQAIEKSGLQGGKGTQIASLRARNMPGGDVKQKDLVGIPWMLAFALRSDGWYLRQDIIWSKPNAMPESVTDRCTRSHEYIFMFTKEKDYYYDHEAIKTPPAKSSIQQWEQDIESQTGSDRQPGKTNGRMKAVGGGKQRGHNRKHNGFNDRWDSMTTAEQQSMGANRRSVWSIPPAQFKDAHFATFPERIPDLCIKAGCPIGGVIMDPFMGSGTAGLVAKKLGRNYVGLDINQEYIDMANKRIDEFKLPITGEILPAEVDPATLRPGNPLKLF